MSTSSLLRGRASFSRPLLLALAAIAGVALGLLVRETGALERLELSSIDKRFEIRGEQAPDDRFLIVALDGTTYSELDRPVGPLPRRLQARALHNLLDADPQLVIYDIVFTGRTDPRDDRALLDAIEAGGEKVLLGTSKVTASGAPSIAWGAKQVEDAGARIGVLAIPSDSDGVLRHMEDEIEGLPTLPFEVARALGENPELDGERYIDYAGPAQTYPKVSFSELLSGSIPDEELKDKIVILGGTDPLLQDLYTTSFSDKRTPGVEIQANAIATALDDFPLAGSSGLVDVLLIVVMAVGGAFAWVWGLRSVLLAPLLAAAFLGLTVLAFNAGTVLEVVPPLVALGGAFSVAGIGELVVTSGERSRARTNLMRFAPPEVAGQLLSSAAEPRLGGVELDATVVFVDLSGFTTFAETQPAPVVIEALNRYLGAVTDVIRDHGGTIVAFLGDGVMAVFGAPLEQPDHADRAVKAAAEMGERVREPFNAWLEEERLDERINLGVGVASGPVMSGLVGNEWRTEYAAVGDTTNVAARLQGEAKKRDLLVLLTDATRERLSDSVSVTQVGEVALRGRAEPLVTWTVDQRATDRRGEQPPA